MRRCGVETEEGEGRSVGVRPDVRSVVAPKPSLESGVKAIKGVKFKKK